MKYLVGLGCCLFQQVIFATTLFIDDASMSRAYMAASIAQSFLYQPSLVRSLDKTWDVDEHAKALMADWNLFDQLSISSLNEEDVQQASLILTMTDAQKQRLEQEYPFAKNKVFSLTECSHAEPLDEPNDNLVILRDRIFSAEERISAGHWQCQIIS